MNIQEECTHILQRDTTFEDSKQSPYYLKSLEYGLFVKERREQITTCVGLNLLDFYLNSLQLVLSDMRRL